MHQKRNRTDRSVESVLQGGTPLRQRMIEVTKPPWPPSHGFARVAENRPARGMAGAIRPRCAPRVVRKSMPRHP